MGEHSTAPGDAVTSAMPGGAAAARLMRPPREVMSLARMGASFPTRLSFMRSLIRRMQRERWQIDTPRFELDDDGFGVAVYRARTPARTYCLVCFAHDLDPEKRTDRVIAEAWDATFALMDDEPDDADIARLAGNVPRQEAGRCSDREIVLSRANKSLRLFEHVVARLAAGRQPDPEMLAGVGYLMRTTAVYGNGKFGMADRARYSGWPEVRNAFQAEMLAVYLIRCFTIDLVEHVARRRGGAAATGLTPELKRYLGIGNSTGLGMAPFLLSHPLLVHNWVEPREAALARVRALENAGRAERARFVECVGRARRHIDEWQVDDDVQTGRIAHLRRDLAQLATWVAGEETFGEPYPWDALYRRAKAAFSLEGQELLAALMLEPHGPLIDDLTEGMNCDADEELEPRMTCGALRHLVEDHYGWTLEYDLTDPASLHYFWYISEHKLEPRLGERGREPGAEWESVIVVVRAVQNLLADLAHADDEETVAAFVLRHPSHRQIVRRVQTVARAPYGEIYDNVVGAAMRPIDLLRFKLAFFGASKFDPKSDRWTRITMFQGAPAPEELWNADADDWCFPVMPAVQS